MFASFYEKDVEVLEGEEVVTVTIAKLSGKSLKKALIAEQIEQAAPLKAYGGELLKALRSEALDEAAKSLEAKRSTPEGRAKARYGRYDREAVLVAAIKRWSCEERVKLSPQAIADLDEKTAETLHRAVLDYSLPSLEEEEAEAGKGTAASTSS